MKKVMKWCAVLGISLVAMGAQAETPAESLKSLLQGYERFSARFEQVTRSEQNNRSEVSKGEMKIARPGQFRWETESPFPQLIVSDGSYLWIYDPDLEQATRKPVDASQSNAAALILNGNVAELAEKYDIEMPIKEENEALYELLPKQTQSSFQRIRLFFTNGVMSELMLQDLLGQQTVILLKDAVINEPMDEALFQFTPPEGTDVILSDEA